jgi:folate-dependent phosphoribosylglycinamide formyltransferase PurN
MKKIIIATKDLTTVVRRLCKEDSIKVVGILDCNRCNESNQEPGELEKFASENRIPCYKLKQQGEEEVKWIRDKSPDLIVVYKMPFLMSEKLFKLPKYGAINIHPSLLPQYPGLDPCTEMIRNKEKEGGVTIHKIDRYADHGEILWQKQFEIPAGSTAESLREKSMEFIDGKYNNIVRIIKKETNLAAYWGSNAKGIAKTVMHAIRQRWLSFGLFAVYCIVGFCFIKITPPAFSDRTDIGNWTNLFLSATIAGIGTFFSLREYSKDKLNDRIQKEILKKLILHFYMVKVYISAIKFRLREEGYDKYYPAERNILFLKVLPEQFPMKMFHRPDQIDKLLEAQRYIHIFNMELDIVLEHLKNKKVSAERKEIDFRILEDEAAAMTGKICYLMRIFGFVPKENDNAVNQVADPEARAWILEVADKYLTPKIKKAINRDRLETIMNSKPLSGYYNSDHELAKRMNYTIASVMNDMGLIEFGG